MKRIASVIALLIVMTTGCVTTDTIRTITTMAGNVDVPSSLIEQGPDAVKGYILGKYPEAAPYADVVINRFFPGKSKPVGPPQFVQVPVTYSTNITFLLTEEVGGSKTLDGAKVAQVLVEVKPKAGKAELPPTSTKTMTVGEFVAGTVPVVVPDQPDQPDPTDPPDADDGDLPDNPEIPPEN